MLFHMFETLYIITFLKLQRSGNLQIKKVEVACIIIPTIGNKNKKSIYSIEPSKELKLEDSICQGILG